MNNLALRRNSIGLLMRKLSSVPVETDKYKFEVINSTHRNDVYSFLCDNFRVDEPLSRAANMGVTDIQKCFDGVLDRILKNNVSIMARSKANNEIVGCMLNSVWSRKDFENSKIENEQDFEFNGNQQGVEVIGEILNELHGSFWTLRPDQNVVLHFEISSVNKNHQRQGLASKFMNWTENQALLRSVDATGIVAEASSLANQILLGKRGYKTVSQILLESRKDGKTGEPVLKCDDGTDRVNLVFKEFS